MYGFGIQAQDTKMGLISKINNYDGVKIDKFGDIEIDMGSANTGRLSANLNEVRIKLEIRGEEKGCDDICPEKALIWLECVSENCVEDPAAIINSKSDSGVFETRIEQGIYLYYDLVKLKYWDFIDKKSF